MSPNKIYEWNTKEEEREIRKKNDRDAKFCKSWLEKYKIKIKKEEIDTIKKYSTEIKKILPILEVLRNLDIIY